MPIRRWRAAAGVALGLATLAGGARADDPAPAQPAIRFNLYETAEAWDNVAGGLRTGGTFLSKLRVSATLDGDGLGAPGLLAHVQMFAVNGQSLSNVYVGDVQTVSNIDAPTAFRLFDLWVQQSFGDKGSVRVGLMDLNAEFDSIAPAALFVNSSHGIGPDLSRSGPNGPSIFPTSSLGGRIAWTPAKRFTFRAAAFNATAGDPAHPGAFAIVDFKGGALLIGQADWSFAKDATASLGAWGYTDPRPFIDPARPGGASQRGAYASVEGPISRRLRGWVRVGLTDPAVETVSSYLGGGLVVSLRGDNDEAGLAVARAGIGGAARRARGLPGAETTFEGTYRLKLDRVLSVQPDLQYVIHPASAHGIPNALVLGLRFIADVNAPAGAEDHED